MRFSGYLCMTLCLAGCHTYYVKEPEPLTTGEIIDLTQKGVSADEIIEEIQKRRTVYNMDFQDGLDLHEKGVDQKVIDFMMKSRERLLERRAYYYDPYHHYPPYYYYPTIGFHYGYCW